MNSFSKICVQQDLNLFTDKVVCLLHPLFLEMVMSVYTKFGGKVDLWTSFYAVDLIVLRWINEWLGKHIYTFFSCGFVALSAIKWKVSNNTCKKKYEAASYNI